MKIISFSPPFSLRIFAGWLIALALMLPRIAGGQTLTVQDDVRRFDTLANNIVVLDGKAELHFSGTGDPMPGCTIHLNSPDAWLFLHRILPSQVVSTFLGRIKVDGSAALLDSNVRVVQHENGAVVIPHGAGYSPMEVFEGKQFAGISRQLKLYTYYNDTNLGPLKGAISSFRLKRGYMATIAQQENGTGFSKVYIAQDSDLEVGILPASLENNVRFVRVFPWRWTAKKGWGGGDGHQMRLSWQYDWGAEQNNNSLDTEYVPMRHGRYWPGYDIINAKRNATHVLGFNEPDRPDQANMSVEDVIAQWPELMKSGLRLGAPAVSDGGLNWLYAFIDRCDELGYRVDF
ncbi:MAG: glycosyl hydrolase, partial [Verrucomicrobiota bacterium]